MSLHREIEFENGICRALAAQGWPTPRAMPPIMTSPEAWAQLQKSQGAAAESALLDRLWPELRRRSKFNRTIRQKLKFAVVTEWRLPDLP
jgi:type I restriction enzyme R subunit